MTSPAHKAVAARMRAKADGWPDEAKILAAADLIEAGDDRGWAVHHERKKQAAEAEVRRAFEEREAGRGRG